MKKRISFETAALVLLLGLMLTSLHAQAAIGNTDVLDDILTRYQTVADELRGKRSGHSLTTAFWKMSAP
jgi:hypothetical protein